jgi:hypothetical protein
MVDHETEIRRRISDPGAFVVRRRHDAGYEDDFGEPVFDDERIPAWSARAVMTYVEPLIKPINDLLTEVVKRRDEAAEIPAQIGDTLLVNGLSPSDLWQRYAHAATVITEILTDWSIDADEQPADQA